MENLIETDAVDWPTFDDADVIDADDAAELAVEVRAMIPNGWQFVEA